jgi:hypothetical protein
MDSGDFQHSVESMGFTELALAFAALGCYCLVLNGSMGTQGRAVAAACAALAAAAFAASTDPWTHGVILMALGVAAMGVFVAAVWMLSALCGVTVRAARKPVRGTAPAALQGHVAPAARQRTASPIRSA